MIDVSHEALRDWAKLETDYVRELMLIKTRFERIPSKFE